MSSEPRRPRRIGIAGGLGALGAADICFKLVQAAAAGGGAACIDLVFEQQVGAQAELAADADADAAQTPRKLHLFDSIRSLERRGVDAVLLPCFISHAFLDELQAELRVPVPSMLDALVLHLARCHPQVRRLGVLTSSLARHQRLFERCFAPLGYDVIQPTEEIQSAALMPAIYGSTGIGRGQLQGAPIDRLEQACRELLARGAELIVPGLTEIPIVVDALRARGLPVVDSNRVYAAHALSGAHAIAAPRSFKIGVVGGVGPAATVDFLGKIVRNTPARRDQDHIKLIVEHNPQIPDRSANLLDGAADPTLALYATCKKLEAGGADLIAIPCNTAHAYVERIQPRLSVAIVNMLHETVRHLRQQHPQRRTVGLLATSGTLGSRVYHAALGAAGLAVVTPDETHQRHVMNAIYGEHGAKAGFTQGRCIDELQQAIEHLVERGADALIFGCTELPLLIPPSQAMHVAGRSIVVLDPTEILAQRCVALARADAG